MFKGISANGEYRFIAMINESEGDVIGLYFLTGVSILCVEISQDENLMTGQAAINWTKMKKGTADGAMPEKLSVNILARVTAGLAKLVDDVNQYPAEIYSPTSNGRDDGR